MPPAINILRADTDMLTRAETNMNGKMEQISKQFEQPTLP